MSSDGWRSLGPLFEQDRRDSPIQGWERTVSGAGLPTSGAEPKPRKPPSPERREQVRLNSKAWRERKRQEKGEGLVL